MKFVKECGSSTSCWRKSTLRAIAERSTGLIPADADRVQAAEGERAVRRCAGSAAVPCWNRWAVALPCGNALSSTISWSTRPSPSTSQSFFPHAHRVRRPFCCRLPPSGSVSSRDPGRAADRRMGDRAGRRPALMLTIGLMRRYPRLRDAVVCAIGIAAPVILVAPAGPGPALGGEVGLRPRCCSNARRGRRAFTRAGSLRARGLRSWPPDWSACAGAVLSPEQLADWAAGGVRFGPDHRAVGCTSGAGCPRPDARPTLAPGGVMRVVMNSIWAR